MWAGGAWVGASAEVPSLGQAPLLRQAGRHVAGQAGGRRQAAGGRRQAAGGRRQAGGRQEAPACQH